MPSPDAAHSLRTRGAGGDTGSVARAPAPKTEPSGTPPPADWLSRTDVARLFQVSASTVTRWAREGKVPARRTPGGHYRYPAAEVRRLAGNSGCGDLVRLD
jgi:excisionase family DNA binding protein